MSQGSKILIIGTVLIAIAAAVFVVLSKGLYQNTPDQFSSATVYVPQPQKDPQADKSESLPFVKLPAALTNVKMITVAGLSLPIPDDSRVEKSGTNAISLWLKNQMPIQEGVYNPPLLMIKVLPISSQEDLCSVMRNSLQTAELVEPTQAQVVLNSRGESIAFAAQELGLGDGVYHYFAFASDAFAIHISSLTNAATDSLSGAAISAMLSLTKNVTPSNASCILK